MPRRILAVFCALLFASCFGMSSDITIKKDGSGAIALEYYVSKDFIELGRLDGNAALPTMPIGEEDFKRTVQRIDGLSLVKFSSKLKESNYVYNITLAFTKIEALINFLDTQGLHCAFAENGGKKILTIVCLAGTEEYEPEMLELIPVIFDGYNFQFKINLPAASDVVFLNRDAAKAAAPPVGSAELSARGVNFSAPLGELFTSPETVTMEITW